MKSFCPVCMALLETEPVIFNGAKAGFSLTPEHKPQKGALVEMSGVVDARTGKTVATFCNGSYRPVREKDEAPVEH